MAGGHAKVHVQCPYYRTDNGSQRIVCEGVLADEPVINWMPSREALRRQIQRYCAGEYWMCPLCEAIDGKYARREEESGSDHDHRPCAGDQEE